MRLIQLGEPRGGRRRGPSRTYALALDGKTDAFRTPLVRAASRNKYGGWNRPEWRTLEDHLRGVVSGEIPPMPLPWKEKRYPLD